MKVIRNGQTWQHQPKRFTCAHCKSELEAPAKEAKRKVCDQRDGNSYVFECAVCSQEVWVDTSVFERGGA